MCTEVGSTCSCSLSVILETAQDQLEEWLHYGTWAVAFDYGRTPGELATALLVPVRRAQVFRVLAAFARLWCYVQCSARQIAMALPAPMRRSVLYMA